MGPKYEGVPLRLGDEEYVLPSLSLEALEKHWPLIESISQPGSTMVANCQAMAVLLHAALARNYPRRWGLWGGISLRQVKKGLDMAGLLAAHEALMKVSGLMRCAPGEPAAGSAPTGV